MSSNEAVMATLSLTISRDLIVIGPRSNTSFQKTWKTLEKKKLDFVLKAYFNQDCEFIDDYLEIISNAFHNNKDSFSSVLKFETEKMSLFPSSSLLEDKTWQVRHIPIWERDDLLDKIVITFFDIGKLSILERKLGQIIEKEKEENFIINELVQNDRFILEGFFSEAYEILKDSKRMALISKIKTHTLKNVFANFQKFKEKAKILKFSYILDKIEHEDKKIAPIRDLYYKNRECNEEGIESILRTNSALVLITSKYAKYADKILKISDKFFLENIQDIHRLTNKLIVRIHTFQADLKSVKGFDESDLDRSRSDVLGFIEALDEVSTEFDKPYLNQGIKELKKSFHNSTFTLMNNELPISFMRELEKFVKISKNDFISSPMGEHFNFEKGNWSKLAYDTFLLSLTIEKENRSQCHDMAMRLRTFCGENQYFYLERRFTSLSNLLKGEEKYSKEEYRYFLKKIWEFLCFVIYREASENLSIGLRKEFKKELLENETKGLMGIIERHGDSSCLFISFLNIFYYSGNELPSLFSILEEIFDLKSPNDVIDLFLEANKSSVDINQEITTNLYNEESIKGIYHFLDEIGVDNQLIIQIKNILDVNPIKDQVSRYFSVTDIFRVLKAQVENVENLEDLNLKMVTIPHFNIINLQNEYREISNKDPERFKSLTYFVDHLLDLPVISHLNRMKSLASEMAHEVGKEAILDIYGAHIFLPEKYITIIKTSLIQLLKNSIYHGIESVDDRITKKKAPIGSLSLSFKNECDSLSIMFGDDGRGVDVKMIKDKSLTLKIHKPNKIDELSEEELMNALFKIGYYNKGSGNVIKGNQSGLNVIKSLVEGVGGSCSIQSKSKEWFRVFLKLPLTEL